MEEQKRPTVAPVSGRPRADLPTIFSDGVTNFANSGSVAKFYLFRTDPDIDDPFKFYNEVAAQVVMTIPAFVQTVVFFENSLQRLISQKLITEEELADLRSFRGVKEPEK